MRSVLVCKLFHIEKLKTKKYNITNKKHLDTYLKF